MSPGTMSNVKTPDHQVTGDSDVTVFLLHGAYGSKDYWRYQTARLVQKGYRVVAWDAPGYGLSPLPSPYSIGFLAQACGRLIEVTGTKTNVVFGHSMGGHVVPKVRHLFPKLVHGLVISASIGYFGNRSKAEQEEFIRARIGSLDQGKKMESASETVVTSMFGPGAGGPEVELIRQVTSATPTDTFRAAIKAIQEYGDAEALEAIRSVNIPTLSIAGGVDPTGRKDNMRRVAEMIPTAEFVVVEGAGHYAWAEKPEEFNRHLFGFLDRHFPVSRQARTQDRIIVRSMKLGD